ncbi:MAG: EamA family transporter [Candidatus Zipacnadales bacterium]
MPLYLALSLLLVAICLGATGQVLIKIGLRNLGTHPTPAVVVMSLFRSPFVASGFACYGISSVLYLLALSKLALSYAYPMIALSYVIVTVLAWRLLNESVPTLRIVGLSIIMFGVIVVAFSHRAETPPDTLPSPPSSMEAEAPD